MSQAGKDRRSPILSLDLLSFLILLFVCWLGLFIGLADAVESTKEFMTTTVTKSTLVGPDGWQAPAKGHPKLATSMYALSEAYRLKGWGASADLSLFGSMVFRDDLVQVVIVTDESGAGDVWTAVEALGGEPELHYGELLQAFVPIGALEILAERGDVLFIREPRRAIPAGGVPPELMVGTETTQGVAVSNASAWQAVGYDGTGLRVAVIDAGFDGYGGLLGTDLPGSVTTYDWTGGGIGGTIHGTACAEIVYDMAYGAAMDLHKVHTNVELGNAVNQAIVDGADIISMSLGWLIDGPGDGTGYLAGITNNARSNGIFYATAAGNNAEYCWSGTFTDTNLDDLHEWAPGQNVNFFGPGDGTAYILPVNFQITVGLHWDDWTLVNQDYDLYLYRWDGANWQLVAYSRDWQDGGLGQQPIEYINILAPIEAPYGVQVHRWASTRDVCLRLIASHSGGAQLDERVSQRSVVFPGDSPDAIAVGAVDVVSPYPLEGYSSQGPAFGPGGVCEGGSTKPDIAAYADVDTVSYGPGGFGGTSAATPHVAGAAALVKDANPGYTVDDLQGFLESNAADLGSPGKDNLYGAGRLLLPAPPCVDVPYVVDMWQGDAELAIIAAGLSVGEITYESTCAVPEGRVISQNPVAGTCIDLGSPVGLLVSLGIPKKTICSTLGDDRVQYSRDLDRFQFSGKEGETVTIRVGADPPVAGAGKKVPFAFSPHLMRRRPVTIPFEFTVTLPATGFHYVSVGDSRGGVKLSRGEKYLGEYRITLESCEQDTVESFQGTLTVEP